MWLNAMMSTEANEPHSIKELVVERYPYTRCVTDAPRPFRTERRGVSQPRADATLDQFRLTSAIHLPLFPLETPQTMANPAVHVSQHLGRLAKAKIAYPPPEVLIEGGDDLTQASPLVASRQRFDSRFETRQGLGSNLASLGRSAPAGPI